MKYCPCCKTKKKYNEFYKNSARKDGLDVYCSYCKKQKQEDKQQQKVKQRLIEQFIDGEIWKDIIEFDGYECSTEGRIRNKTTKQLLNPSKCCSGYSVSNIRGKNLKFHRIIAQTFLPNFENKPTVEHKDDIKHNNRIYNLKWATHEQQQQYVKDKKSKQNQSGVEIGTNDMTNLENEKWKIITDYPDYEISNMGRIKYPIRKGLHPYKMRISTGGFSADGYKTFELRNTKGQIKTVIHRLVAQEFISNPDNYNVVNHEDGVKHNNKFDNLKWCTRSENTQHAYDNDLISGKRKIYQLDINNNIIKEWNTIKDAYQQVKLSRTAINNVLSGKNKTAGGYYWCYKEKYDTNKKKNTKYDTNKRKIKQLNKETNEPIKIWNSISEVSEIIAKENNSSIKAIKSNISQCIRKQRNSCQGFKWEYC